MEGRQGQVLLGDALVEEGLDVCLGVDAAAARYVVDASALGGARVELLHGDVKQLGYLVDEGAGAARAAAVHAHVAHGDGAACAVAREEDHLGVLAAQLYGGAGLGVEAPDGDGVGNDLLDEGDAQGLRDGRGARAGDGAAHLGGGEALGDGAQRLGHGLGLARAVALVLA